MNKANEMMNEEKPTKVKLFKHQQDLVDKNPDRQLIAWGTGVGKTYGGLALARAKGLSTLIVCPKRVKEKWIKQSNEWLTQHHLVVTKEEFRRDYKKLDRFDCIITDEAHLGFGNHKSLLHKAMAAYIKVHSIKHVYLLTGTPYTSTPWSIFSLAKLLGHNWNWYEFRSQFFKERYLGARIIWEPREGTEDEIADLVRSIGDIVRLDECTDVPVQRDEFEIFSMTKEQRDAMDEMKKREDNPLTRFGKSHQIAQGIQIGDEFRPTEFYKSPKNERILELAQENDKLAVFTRYTYHIDQLNELLTKKGIPVYIIRGDTKEPEAVMEQANASKRCVILINSECAEGYELPTFSIIVFASLSYSFVKYEQARGRFLRINAMKPNLYIHLISDGPTDAAVWESVKRKRNFSEAIYSKENVL